MSELLVVLVTGPDAERLAALGRTLVAERLCACANVVPAITSIYRWQGEVHEDAESLAILKTARDRLDALSERVLELHPYDVPEVLALPVAGGTDAYLDWLRASVG